MYHANFGEIEKQRQGAPLWTSGGILHLGSNHGWRWTFNTMSATAANLRRMLDRAIATSPDDVLAIVTALAVMTGHPRLIAAANYANASRSPGRTPNLEGVDTARRMVADGKDRKIAARTVANRIGIDEGERRRHRARLLRHLKTNSFEI